jgi:alpha-L-rhamnosidase
VLYVNGERIGRGPVRCWPFEQAYDTYEIGHLLKRGRSNSIAVLVLHFGVSTFYYLRGRGGLLAQLDLMDGQRVSHTIATDASWKTARHLGQDPRAPRMSCQQAFAERIDARSWDEEWVMPDFNESSWKNAVVIGDAGMAPWTLLKPRDIPLLTDELVYPVLVESLHKVKPLPWTAVIDTRNQMVPGSENNANAYEYAGYVSIVFRVSAETKAAFGFTYLTPNVNGLNLNGVRYAKDHFTSGKKLEADLSPGDNLLMIELVGKDHGRGLFLGIDCDEAFELVSPVPAGSNDSAFISIGPFEIYEYIDHHFDEDAQAKHRTVAACGRHNESNPQLDPQAMNKYSAFCQAGSIKETGELAPFQEWMRPIPLKMVSKESVLALSVWKKESEPVPVPVSLQQAVMAHPLPGTVPLYEAADTEFIIDFGRELSGFITFEVERPKVQ